MTDFAGDIVPVTPEGFWRAVIDTPKGSRNKYKWDEQLRLFRLAKILPPGFAMPWNYGFLPQTRSGDGDPLDVLVLMEEAAFCGAVIVCRPRGVLMSETKGERNDRLIASPVGEFEDRIYAGALPPSLPDEIEAFFEGYHRLRGEVTKTLGFGGPEEAMRIVADARKGFAAA